LINEEVDTSCPLHQMFDDANIYVTKPKGEDAHPLTLYTLPRSTPSRVGSIDVPANMLTGGGNDDGAMPVIPERKIPIGEDDDDNDDDA
jgi:hypothetical protein